jgi:putative tryptophan/tyrosine transport system substrate-binding protein
MKSLRFAVAAALLAGLAHPAWAQSKSVAITAIVEHPALDAVRDGVIDALKDAGFVDGQNLKVTYQSAQGNPATATQIARQFVGQKPDVIVPISTPSAQAVAAATKDLPIVFGTVTDPVGAQLVKDRNAPGGNITGVSDFPPLAAHLDLIREILPNAKRIGVPYNPGDANSVALLAALKKAAGDKGFTVVEAAANKSSEVQGAARGLVGRADVVYTMLDNMVVSALESVIAVGQQNKLPVIAGDTDSVERGAIASIGFDYRKVGRQVGEVVVRVLKGEAPGKIAVVDAKGTDLFVNPAAAEAMGVAIPDALKARAVKVVQK